MIDHRQFGGDCRQSVLNDADLNVFFEQFYVENYTAVFHFFLRALNGNAQEAENLAQETLLDFLEKLLEGKVRLGEARKLLWSIAHNKMNEYLKRNYYGYGRPKGGDEVDAPRLMKPLDKQVHEKNLGVTQPMHQMPKTVEREVEERQQQTAIETAKSRLSPTDREIFECRVEDQMHWREIQAKTGLDAQAARKRLTEIKKKVRKFL